LLASGLPLELEAVDSVWCLGCERCGGFAAFFLVLTCDVEFQTCPASRLTKDCDVSKRLDGSSLFDADACCFAGGFPNEGREGVADEVVGPDSALPVLADANGFGGLW
jgi:hypothetical protein